MPTPLSLAILSDLRREAGLSQADMGRLCGLTGRRSHQTAGAWERGEYAPAATRRVDFMHYLWDGLGLRRDAARFEEVWDLLAKRWGWAGIDDNEWRAMTRLPRPAWQQADAEPGDRPPPFQAPALIPHFIGREATIKELAALLTGPDSPHTVALVGMGGVGKTTLATHVAHALRSYFSGGVLWATVATAHPLQILQMWAQTLGYDFSGITDLENRGAAMRGILADRQLLIVLDDVRSVDVVRPLLPGTSSCAVLMTMRDQDIATVLNVNLFTLRELQLSEGLALLARLIGEERMSTDRPAAHTICSILEGYPLAIEIIGKLLSRNPWQSLSEIASRLQNATQRLDQLKLKNLSVRASFDVSWHALSEALSERFVTLGVFAGRAFDLPAVAAIGQSRIELATEEMVTLVALSLVNVDSDGFFRQHPLLADYALEQMNEQTALYTRFSDYYLAFCQMPTTDDRQLEHAMSNIMAAMTAAHQLGQGATVIEYALALAAPWLRCAWYDEARQGYALAVDSARPNNVPTTLATLFVNWGMVCSDQGDFAEAERHLTAAVELATTHALPASLADAQFHLIRIALERGDYEEVDELITACQQVRVALHDRVGLARVYHHRALLLYRNGEYRQAKQLGEEALAIQQTEQDTLGLLLTLRLLADVAISEKDFAVAKQHCQHALQLATPTTYRSELAETYYSLATIHRLLNEAEQAWRYAADAYHHFVQIGNRWFQAYTLYEQSKIKQLVGELPAALALGLKSLDLLSDLGDTYNRVNCLLQLGDLYRQFEQVSEAERLWGEGMTLAQSIHHPKIDEFHKRLMKPP
ncbi:MAG: AAA family ATPase [Caldilineaceae bacterium]|nr:AAA family ATPase [Caldilineaceae bacterium]MBP8106939.1 AAA family ATPase [Caldilineaceae bacterium]MBP8121859.1 AAA family ATPase [Caldilineaceae bacterium]MBP9072159.1 AAA family ATPase [Caldilineaceae bacterium]